MIKLNSVCSTLENLQEKVETKIEECEEKQTALEDNAYDKDRDMTSSESQRYEQLDEEIADLQSESDAISNAIAELSDFCD